MRVVCLPLVVNLCGLIDCTILLEHQLTMIDKNKLIFLQSLAFEHLHVSISDSMFYHEGILAI